MRNFSIAIAALTLMLLGCDRRQPAEPQAQASAAGSATAGAPAPSEPPHHHANVAPTQGNQASGTLEFIPRGDVVAITGTINGLEPGSIHGFHVHEKGDCSAPDASSAGGHFNPNSQPHGSPDTPPHHAGDIRSITADAQGVAQVNVQLSGVSLSTGGPDDILGKSVVIHAKPDDYKTQPSGASGDRIACGVIE